MIIDKTGFQHMVRLSMNRAVCSRRNRRGSMINPSDALGEMFGIITSAIFDRLLDHVAAPDARGNSHQLIELLKASPVRSAEVNYSSSEQRNRFTATQTA